MTRTHQPISPRDDGVPIEPRLKILDGMRIKLLQVEAGRQLGAEGVRRISLAEMRRTPTGLVTSTPMPTGGSGRDLPGDH